MPQTIEVRFKGTRRDYYIWQDDRDQPRLQDAVIVEAERGKDLGHVSAVGEVALAKCGTSCSGCSVSRGKAVPTDPRKILRRAAPNEVVTSVKLRQSEEEVRRRVLERVRRHKLPMKVSDAEWQWDRNKLTIYFTAEQRVDFRALVRDLASLFRTRIDLRQIGVRDEAARLGGVGRCGKEYCCSSWLPELTPVSLSLAKDQRLALNPAQISGGCGRLLCCLKYEHEFYVSARKRFPKEGKTLQTAAGPQRVVAVDIFRERVLLREAEGTTRTVALAELRQEIQGAGPGRDATDTLARPEPGPSRDSAGPATGSPAEPTGEGSEPAADCPPSKSRRRRRRGRGRRRPPGPEGSSNTET